MSLTCSTTYFPSVRRGEGGGGGRVCARVLHNEEVITCLRCNAGLSGRVLSGGVARPLLPQTCVCVCARAPPRMACSVLSEKHLLCWLCGEVFRQPVSTPCGHSFCARCLSQRWSAAGSASCPRCRRLFSQRPQLSVNRILDDLCCHYRSATPPPPKHTVRPGSASVP